MSSDSKGKLGEKTVTNLSILLEKNLLFNVRILNSTTTLILNLNFFVLHFTYAYQKKVFIIYFIRATKFKYFFWKEIAVISLY